LLFCFVATALAQNWNVWPPAAPPSTSPPAASSPTSSSAPSTTVERNICVDLGRLNLEELCMKFGWDMCGNDGLSLNVTYGPETVLGGRITDPNASHFCTSNPLSGCTVCWALDAKLSIISSGFVRLCPVVSTQCVVLGQPVGYTENLECRTLGIDCLASSCGDCTRKSGCGWCDLTNECLPLASEGSQELLCANAVANGDKDNTNFNDKSCFRYPDRIFTIYEQCPASGSFAGGGADVVDGTDKDEDPQTGGPWRPGVIPVIDHDAHEENISSKIRHTALIASLSAVAGGLALIGLGLGVYYYRRKRALAHRELPDPPLPNNMDMTVDLYPPHDDCASPSVTRLGLRDGVRVSSASSMAVGTTTTSGGVRSFAEFESNSTRTGEDSMSLSSSDMDVETSSTSSSASSSSSTWSSKPSSSPPPTTTTSLSLSAVPEPLSPPISAARPHRIRQVTHLPFSSSSSSSLSASFSSSSSSSSSSPSLPSTSTGPSPNEDAISNSELEIGDTSSTREHSISKSQVEGRAR